MSRSAIFNAINTERDTQDCKWGPGHDDGHHDSDWRRFIAEHASRAAGDEFCRQMVRVAALAVAAIESYERQYGTSTEEGVTMSPGPGKPGRTLSCDCDDLRHRRWNPVTGRCEACGTRYIEARAPSGGDATDRAAEPSGDPPAGREPASCGGSPATGQPERSCETCMNAGTPLRKEPCRSCQTTHAVQYTNWAPRPDAEEVPGG